MITAIITIGMIYSNKNGRFTKSPTFIKYAIKHHKFALYQLYPYTAKYANIPLPVSACGGWFSYMGNLRFSAQNPTLRHTALPQTSQEKQRMTMSLL